MSISLPEDGRIGGLRRRIPEGILRRNAPASGIRPGIRDEAGRSHDGRTIQRADILTAENLRGEISDLWERGSFPSKSIVVDSRPIE